MPRFDPAAGLWIWKAVCDRLDLIRRVRTDWGRAEVGLRKRQHSKHMKDPVGGIFLVTSCTVEGGDAAHPTCRLQGVVNSVLGIDQVTVEHVCTVPANQLPQPGQDLPVRVDRADPGRLEIRWEDMPAYRERGHGRAERKADRLAAQMTGEQDLWAGQPDEGYAQQPQAPGFTPGPQLGGTLPPGLLPPAMQSALEALAQGGASVTYNVEAGSGSARDALAALLQAAQAGGASVTYAGGPAVFGDPGRPLPGQAGVGLTPEQAAAAASGAGSAAGMQQATARVLAVHDIPIPPGIPGAPPAGLADLTLQVELPDGTSYTTRMRTAFSTPGKRATITEIGAALPVLVNPAARDQVAIDTSRLA